MSSAGQQTRRDSDSTYGRVQPADGKPGAPKGSGQLKMPPGRTWLWFMLALLANFLLVRLLMPSPEGPVTVDAEVRRIIGESHDEARGLLTVHRKQLDALAQAMLARETLNEQEILEVTGLPPAPALETGILPVPNADRRIASRDKA
jgi:hypothetical protein